MIASSSILHGYIVPSKPGAYFGFKHCVHLTIFAEEASCFPFPILHAEEMAEYEHFNEKAFKQMTIWDVLTKKVNKVFVSVKKTAEIFRYVKLSESNIEKALNDDKLLECIVEGLAESFLGLFAEEKITKEHLCHLLYQINRRYRKDVRVDITTSPVNPLSLGWDEEGLFFKSDKKIIHYDFGSLVVSLDSLSSAWIPRNAIPVVINVYESFWEKILGHFLNSIDPVVIDFSSTATGMLGKVIVISPSEAYLDMGCIIGRGGFKTVKKVVDVFSGKVRCLYEVNVPPEEKFSIDDKINLEEINTLLAFRKTKGVIGLEHLIEKKIKRSLDGISERIYLILKYCNLGSLSEYVDQLSVDLTLKEQCEIAYKIATALEKIHKRNCAHKDLKLQNIFMHRSKKGELKVVLGDLGSLVELTQLTKRKLNLTTSWFVSPEYAKAFLSKSSADKIEANGQSLDIWSLGVVFYELFYQERPPWLIPSPAVDLKNNRAAIQAIADLKFPISCPEGVEEVPLISKMLSLEPRPTIAEVMSGLEDMLSALEKP